MGMLPSNLMLLLTNLPALGTRELVLSYKALDASAMDQQMVTSLLHHQDLCIRIEMSVL